MSELNPTLNDLTSRMTSDGRIDPRIVEILSETNEMLDDITFVEATGAMENVTTVRSGLPEVAWRQQNYGVKPSKSKTKQVTDTIGMLEAFAEVDKKLVELNGNKAAFRLSEDRAFIEAMNQEMQRALIYGNLAVDPAKIMGFMPRFSTANQAKAENAINVIDAGGTGNDLASILLTVWSPNTVFCMYPKGLPGGLKSTDLGEQTLVDADGGKYRGYQTHYEWNTGLTVRDWRYVVRIANIDVSALKADPGANDVNLIDLMTDALELVPNIRAGRAAFYCNKTIRAYLRKQVRNAKNVNLTVQEVMNRPTVVLEGVPIRRFDAMVKGEKRVI